MGVESYGKVTRRSSNTKLIFDYHTGIVRPGVPESLAASLLESLCPPAEQVPTQMQSISRGLAAVPEDSAVLEHRPQEAPFQVRTSSFSGVPRTSSFLLDRRLQCLTTLPFRRLNPMPIIAHLLQLWKRFDWSLLPLM